MRSLMLTVAFLPLFASAALPGDPSEYFDILGTGHKDWRLAFRGTAGIRKSMYPAYNDGTGIGPNVEEGCKSTNWTALCTDHYRNADAIDNWNNVREVLYGIVDDGVLIKTLRFKGDGTTKLNWMSKDRLVKSCWEDLKTDSVTNYFGLAGHAAVGRRFFISHRYNGCPGDTSWTVVVDSENLPGMCPWDRAETFPFIKYVPGQRYENINSARVKSAQAIVVFVNYYPGETKEYHDLFRTGKQEWRLAFRGTAGTGSSIYRAYTGCHDDAHADGHVDPGCSTADFKLPCHHHYRNDDALDNWKNIDEVLVGLISKGEMVKTIMFCGENTTYKDWFGIEHLKDSCWDDVKRGPHRYFSIDGDVDNQRRFFIQRNYGGCNNDRGWMVVSDMPTKPCPWELAEYSYPLVKFAASPRAENWTDGEVTDADGFAIFLKYKEL